MVTICPACGRNSLETKCGEFVFEVPPDIPGGPIYVPDAEWAECSSCGERTLSYELFNALHAERSRRLGLLSAEEIRAIRKNLGLTQIQMAGLLGVGEKTYTRWESGKSVQNKSSDNLIRVADQDPESLMRLEARREPGRDDIVRGYLRNLQKGRSVEAPRMAAYGADLSEADKGCLLERLEQIEKSQDGVCNE